MVHSAPKHTVRRRLLLAAILAGGALVLGRGAQLQLVQGKAWRVKALEQQRERLVLPAARGGIYDRNGVPLAASREVYRLAVAPREVADPAGLQALLERTLGLSRAQAKRAVAPSRRWVVLPGLHDVDARRALEGTQGVHFERVLRRFYPRGELGLEVLGAVGPDGTARGGLELELDSLLAGRPGEAVLRRDAQGEPIPGSMLRIAEPLPGQDVYLTLDAELQEIAEEALSDAVAETGAQGGELVMADPRTGEVLAAASAGRRRTGTWGAAIEPYEPGSTFKPFLVATLLELDRARMADSVFAENGRYTHEGRTLTDVHGYGWLSVHDALKFSSNVAMAKLSTRLSRDEQYARLRDFGFGAPTGVRYPAESAGLLRNPGRWSRYSQASLAIGYEISVTPLQMVLAYGALANGGVLMEPRLVREVRARSGAVVRRFEPQAVRRVVSRGVADHVRSALRDVVQTGTGTAASIGTFELAGKTGTARQSTGGGYTSGAYTASFAGFFPVVDPQLVFLVKLDRPRGDYYGGLTAAPVMRTALTAALAARDVPLDRRAMAKPARRAPVRPASAVRLASFEAADPGPPTEPFIFAVDGAKPERRGPAGLGADRPVPEVAGLSARDAARRLHRGGFRVRLSGSGPASGTEPAAGTEAAVGSLVTVVGREDTR